MVLLAFVLVLSVGCEKNNRKSPKQLLAEEMALLDEFYAKSDSFKVWVDRADGDTIDNRETSGLMYFQLEEGTGDTVQVGKMVGYRFQMYYLARDSAGAPTLWDRGNNYGQASPIEYMAGQPNPRNGIYTGLDQGIRYMKRFGKSRLIIPSPIGGGDYWTRIYEVEVTYQSK
ncbi:hypothetical protein DMA11_20975 [Marinilabiliaceae bacterium JC017]|nr:hypothetical protein DMA11_20975 [Marinilabiliaceae bacterium JC017]